MHLNTCKIKINMNQIMRVHNTNVAIMATKVEKTKTLNATALDEIVEHKSQLKKRISLRCNTRTRQLVLAKIFVSERILPLHL